MLFVDYNFDLLENDAIVMDKELKPESLRVKDGDTYVVSVTFDRRIIFHKVGNTNGRSS